MNPELQRVKIAEACGKVQHLVECPECYGTGFSGSELDREPCPLCEMSGQVKMYLGRIPDYLSCLNACHEMERVLTDEQHRLFRKLLFTGVYNRGEGQTNDSADRGMVSATAPQRCEAFLRVMGLWQDS